MKLVIAPDKFKGCLSARQVAEAIDCRLIDHLIFGGTSFTSFRELGLL